jgi:hypothetical protein
MRGEAADVADLDDVVLSADGPRDRDVDDAGPVRKCRRWRGLLMIATSVLRCSGLAFVDVERDEVPVPMDSIIVVPSLFAP